MDIRDAATDGLLALHLGAKSFLQAGFKLSARSQSGMWNVVRRASQRNGARAQKKCGLRMALAPSFRRAGSEEVRRLLSGQHLRFRRPIAAAFPQFRRRVRRIGLLSFRTPPRAQKQREIAPSKFTPAFLCVSSGRLGPGGHSLLGSECLGDVAFLPGRGGGPAAPGKFTFDSLRVSSGPPGPGSRLFFASFSTRRAVWGNGFRTAARAQVLRRGSDTHWCAGAACLSFRTAFWGIQRRTKKIRGILEPGGGSAKPSSGSRDIRSRLNLTPRLL